MQTLTLLSDPIYRRYWISMLISNLGNWMQGATLAWLVLSLEGSAAALGLVVSLQFLPSLLFSLPAGQLADSLPRSRIVLTTQILVMILAVLMALLIWSEQVVYWHLLIFAFCQGTLTAFDMPARQALVVELVSKSRYPQAQSLNSFTFNISRLVGPALAGLCIGSFGMAWAYWINALTFVPLLFTLMSLPSVARSESSKRGGLLGGLRFAWNTPLVRKLLLLLGWVSIFGVNFQTLIPAYSRLVLGLPVEGYGLLLGCLGGGALAGSIWQIWSTGARPGRIYKGGLALALLHLLMGLQLPVWAVGALWAGCGFAMVTVMLNTNTSVQTVIPDELRGRVMAVYSMVLLGAAPLGAWLTGRLFDGLGGRTAPVVMGLITAIGLLALMRNPLPAVLTAES